MLQSSDAFVSEQKRTHYYDDYLIVRGSNGSFVARMDNGLVVHHDCEDQDKRYQSIVAVDIDELLGRHIVCRCTVCEHKETDILGIGFWDLIDGELVYEPPCEDWLRDLDNMD